MALDGRGAGGGAAVGHGGDRRPGVGGRDGDGALPGEVRRDGKVQELKAYPVGSVSFGASPGGQREIVAAGFSETR